MEAEAELAPDATEEEREAAYKRVKNRCSQRPLITTLVRDTHALHTFIRNGWLTQSESPTVRDTFSLESDFSISRGYCEVA